MSPPSISVTLLLHCATRRAEREERCSRLRGGPRPGPACVPACDHTGGQTTRGRLLTVVREGNVTQFNCPNRLSCSLTHSTPASSPSLKDTKARTERSLVGLHRPDFARR